MKYFKILSTLLLCLAFSFYACDEKPKSKRIDPSATPMSPTAVPNFARPASTPNNGTTTAEPAQNVSGIWHYTCSNGCAGGAGSATACATCGAILVHNQAYHASANSSPTLPSALPSSTPSTTTGQNAAGVWHYTCGNGCAGGAGSATACATCGATLAHNQAYHQ